MTLEQRITPTRSNLVYKVCVLLLDKRVLRFVVWPIGVCACEGWSALYQKEMFVYNLRRMLPTVVRPSMLQGMWLGVVTTPVYKKVICHMNTTHMMRLLSVCGILTCLTFNIFYYI